MRKGMGQSGHPSEVAFAMDRRVGMTIKMTLLASLRRGAGRRLYLLVRLEAILLYNAHRELDLQ